MKNILITIFAVMLLCVARAQDIPTRINAKVDNANGSATNLTLQTPTVVNGTHNGTLTLATNTTSVPGSVSLLGGGGNFSNFTTAIFKSPGSAGDVIRAGTGTGGFKIQSGFGFNSGIGNFSLLRSDDTGIFRCSDTVFAVAGMLTVGGTSATDVSQGFSKSSTGNLTGATNLNMLGSITATNSLTTNFFGNTVLNGDLRIGNNSVSSLTITNCNITNFWAGGMTVWYNPPVGGISMMHTNFFLQNWSEITTNNLWTINYLAVNQGINLKGQTLTGVGTAAITNLSAINSLIASGGVSSMKSNLLAAASITIGASPFNWTNTTGSGVNVFVDGVSVTGTVGINGGTIFNTIGQCTVPLGVNEFTTITYTMGTPTATWKPR